MKMWPQPPHSFVAGPFAATPHSGQDLWRVAPAAQTHSGLRHSLPHVAAATKNLRTCTKRTLASPRWIFSRLSPGPRRGAELALLLPARRRR